MTTSPEEQMLDVVAPLWSEAKTREALGLSAIEIAERRAAGTILGLPSSDGHWFYPLSQFEQHHDGVRVRPSLSKFFTMLRNESPWAVGMMAATPADELDGASPVDWVRQDGDIRTLLDFANMLRSQWR